MKKKLYGWFAERYPMDDIVGFMKHQSAKLLPPHTSWWHTFGSLLMFLVINQIVTGILLMVYYRPTPETAFESVKYIMTNANFGWLIRGLHTWGANVMIVALVVHMFRTYVMGAYKKPRELTWVLGVLLFGTTLTFGFTGYLLPWNQLSYWATVVGTEITGAIPIAGEPVKMLLRGGEAVSGETLSRFYVVHVVVLPWVLVFITAIHIVLMRTQGLSPLDPVGSEKPLTERTAVHFFPEHVAKESVIFPVFFAILVAIVLLMPVELGEKADPLATPEGIKPEWYFLPTYQLLKYFPKLLGILVTFIPMLLLGLWPFIDRSPARHPKQRPWSMSIGILALLGALFFGALGYLSERTFTIFGSRVHFDIYGVPHAAVEQVKPEEKAPAEHK